MSISQHDAILSVSQLNTLAKDIIESSFSNILVEGEISNLVAPRSGHLYFSLKDERAQIRVALFAGQKQRLDFKIENGLKVIIKGGLSLYADRGDYQLIARTLQRAGEGALQQQFERLKQALAQRGWFDERHKKPLPDFCQHLAVISSPSGAAIRDILHVLQRRFPLMEVTLIPSLVQGKEAAAKLVAAVHTANRLKRSGKPQFQFDAILLARGGGSLEDLWPFNEEALAQAIFESELPVVSGVGHEIDYTIADWVADFRAPTPSAAAESLSQNQHDISAWLNQAQSDLVTALQQKIMQASHTLHHLSKRCTSPQQLIHERMQTLDYLEHRLLKTQAHTQEKAHATLAFLAARLNSLSPLNTLERGYSITRSQTGKQWQLLAHDQTPKVGEHIQTETHTLLMESQITRITLKKP